MIKILFLAANPLDTNRLRLDEEMRAIDAAVRQGDYRDQFDIRSHWAVRISDLQELLLRYQPDIVHFSGHGSRASEIILQDEQGKAVLVSAEALGALFGLLKDNIRCVVLNSCYSQTQAKSIAQHIECVVGLTDTISEEAAVHFVTAFYRALGYGRNVQIAFDLGRSQIDLSNLPDQQALALIALRTEPTQIYLAGAVSDPQTADINGLPVEGPDSANGGVGDLKNDGMEDDSGGRVRKGRRSQNGGQNRRLQPARSEVTAVIMGVLSRLSKFIIEYIAILFSFWLFLGVLAFLNRQSLDQFIGNQNGINNLWLFLLGAFLLALFRNSISHANFGALLGRLRSIRVDDKKTLNTVFAEFLTRASENVAMQFIAALLPALCITGWAIGVTIVNLFRSEPFMVFSVAAVIWIGIAWTFTGILGILWFLDHKQNWQIRLTGVSNLMERYDFDIHYLLAQQVEVATVSIADRNELNNLIYKAIDDILQGLKDVIAYRFNRETKQAVFIVLRDYFEEEVDHPEGDFDLFAPIHAREIDNRVRLLKRGLSLAGKALDEDRVVTIADCRSPVGAERWQRIANDAEYIGRAAAPVVIFNKERQVRQEIGVLCFDIMVKWTPAAEEEDILETAADRIADLWLLYQRTNAPERGLE